MDLREVSSDSLDLSVAIKASLHAATAIQKIYRTDFEVRDKGDNDPVTEADLSAHRAVVTCIQSFLPQDVVLSEEEILDPKDRRDRDRVWILDPLDGTRDFVARNPEFAVSLGLVEKGEPVLGVVCNPITQELFWGICNSRLRQAFFTGSSSDTDPKQRPQLSILEGKKTILVSRTEYDQGLFAGFLSNSEFSQNYELIAIGSIAYKLGLLAYGKYDAVVSLKPKNEWDICAGIAITRAMGYTSYEIKSQASHRFNQESTLTHGLVAGKPYVVQELRERFGEQLQNSLKPWKLEI